MKTFSLTPTAKTLALAISLVALVLVACSSSDDPEATSTSQPQATQAPVATTPPDPTATSVPATEKPTENPVPTAEPTQAPDATAVPVATSAPAPTVAPTATPDPFVILQSILAGEVDSNRYPEVPPGEGVLLERLFPDAPPYAPHKVSDKRITLKSNQCLTCHEGGFASGGHVATGIPLSHYTDQLTLDVSIDLDPRRYMCTSCHVPQVIEDLPFAE